MKTWEKYSEYLLKGEWHIHTNYTDGKNSVYDYCQKAVEVGIPLVAFTEHVRKNLNYDFCSFLDDIDKVKEEFDLIILSGCEAKVLPNGDLDVNDEILKEIDYPIFAFHSFPADVDIYFNSLKNVLKNKYVNTWAHPGAFLEKKHLQIPDDQFVEILNSMSKRKILLEMNCKYDVPSPKWIDLAKISDICLVKGSDVHNIESFCPL
ncbi:MAG: PHP domain-containing protein [Candidatus Methanomarinus sp.]|uniref:PHP domain-containing protein n=1 Tax=Candidatus Methanomarinus sp. TaxID=3386244 RepID=A0AC61SAB5_9EURY|nr:DNA polymerase [ANME-2 cluster archaeon]TKY91447.1 MAG: PHP domain-containing protein [ANME-2 cluster archaeon]